MGADFAPLATRTPFFSLFLSCPVKTFDARQNVDKYAYVATLYLARS
jgi:hypothetical protein